MFIFIIATCTNKLFIQIPKRTTAGRWIMARNISQYGRKRCIQVLWDLTYVQFLRGEQTLTLFNKKGTNMLTKLYAKVNIHLEWESNTKTTGGLKIDNRSFSSKLKQYPRDAHREVLLLYNLTVPPYLEPSRAPSHKQ